MWVSHFIHGFAPSFKKLLKKQWEQKPFPRLRAPPHVSNPNGPPSSESAFDIWDAN